MPDMLRRSSPSRCPHEAHRHQIPQNQRIRGEQDRQAHRLCRHEQAVRCDRLTKALRVSKATFQRLRDCMVIDPFESRNYLYHEQP